MTMRGRADASRCTASSACRSLREEGDVTSIKTEQLFKEARVRNGERNRCVLRRRAPRVQALREEKSAEDAQDAFGIMHTMEGRCLYSASSSAKGDVGGGRRHTEDDVETLDGAVLRRVDVSDDSARIYQLAAAAAQEHAPSAETATRGWI